MTRAVNCCLTFLAIHKDAHHDDAMCHDIMTHAAAFRTELTMTTSTLSTQGTLVTGAHTMGMFLEDNAQLGTAQVVLTRTATTLARPDRSTKAIHGWIHRPFPCLGNTCTCVYSFSLSSLFMLWLWLLHL
jgi:hypothetical protein